MVNIKTKFPRGINSDQVISGANSTEEKTSRAPGPGLKQQAIEESVPYTDVIEAEASSFELQAAGVKLSNQLFQASSDKRQAPSSKRQA